MAEGGSGIQESLGEQGEKGEDNSHKGVGEPSQWGPEGKVDPETLRWMKLTPYLNGQTQTAFPLEAPPIKVARVYSLSVSETAVEEAEPLDYGYELKTLKRVILDI